ncbi:MAG TPA: 3-phosphoshikimate 1-carboxyvinyltransferase, partial [Dehalococcoidia bacterium]|nr:3-phosphoshikimate 1-carboxyvinyltransferase [Dehalococcoidia bacterium]
HRVTIQPAGALSAIDLTVPGDLSSAAFWIVAAAGHRWARLRLAGVGVNPSRTGLIDVLRQMGGWIQFRDERLVGGEPVADLEVQSSDLQGIDVGGSLIPRLIDEVPALAVAACFARGRTVIRDAAELRVKESDRVHTIATELTKLGAQVTERDDGLEIEGAGRLAGGVTVDSHGDHRLALALAVAGLLAEEPIEITGAEAVAVSYPGFWEDLARVTEG